MWSNYQITVHKKRRMFGNYKEKSQSFKTSILMENISKFWVKYKDWSKQT